MVFFPMNSGKMVQFSGKIQGILLRKFCGNLDLIILKCNAVCRIHWPEDAPFSKQHMLLKVILIIKIASGVSLFLLFTFT